MKSAGATSGVIAALGISVTAAIALPLVNVFKTMQPSELMVVRGGVSAAIIAVALLSRISRPSWQMLKFSVLFASATLALYGGIRAWGVSPTLVVLSTTPVVNIAAKLWRKQTVSRRVYACLGGLIIGVVIALNPWQENFRLLGFVYSVAATILAGIGFEALAGAKGVDPYNKSFWLAVVTAILGFLTTLVSGRIPFATESWNATHVFALIGFGVTGGFLYYLANIVAFEKLKTEVASTLAMAETPAVIVGAWLMLDERMTLAQWMGVAIALGATGVLSAAESKKNEQT